VRLIRVHVKGRAGYVGAIKEHFCSAGRCDDSFMRVPEERRGSREEDEEADWRECWGADWGRRGGRGETCTIAATFSGEVMSRSERRHTDGSPWCVSALSAPQK